MSLVFHPVRAKWLSGDYFIAYSRDGSEKFTSKITLYKTSGLNFEKVSETTHKMLQVREFCCSDEFVLAVDFKSVVLFHISSKVELKEACELDFSDYCEDSSWSLGAIMLGNVVILHLGNVIYFYSIVGTQLTPVEDRVVQLEQNIINFDFYNDTLLVACNGLIHLYETSNFTKVKSVKYETESGWKCVKFNKTLGDEVFIYHTTKGIPSITKLTSNASVVWSYVLPPTIEPIWFDSRDSEFDYCTRKYFSVTPRPNFIGTALENPIYCSNKFQLLSFDCKRTCDNWIETRMFLTVSSRGIEIEGKTTMNPWKVAFIFSLIICGFILFSYVGQWWTRGWSIKVAH